MRLLKSIHVAIVLLALTSAPAFAGMIIVPTFDTTITTDPNAAIIQGTINSVIQLYENTFSDPITVHIEFHEMTSGLGASNTYFGTTSYANWHAALTGDAASADDATALASIPGGPNNPVNGSNSVDVTTASLRALGLNVNPPSGQPDGFIGLKTSIMNLDRTSINPAKYDLYAVAAHEIDEVLGFGSALNNLSNGDPVPTGAIWAMDMFRWASAGTRSFNTNANSTAYFSIDSGVTNLVGFNQTAGGDFSDYFSTGPHTPRVQDAFATPGATPNPSVELRGLDVIGYNLAAPQAVPEPGTMILFGVGLLLVAARACHSRLS